MASSAIKPHPESWRAQSGFRSFIPYFGGKSGLAATFADLAPDSDGVCEACCGACSLLLSMKPRKFEAINDIDRLLMRTYRAVRDHADELADGVALTLYSRAEFEYANNVLHDPDAHSDVEVGRAYLTCICQKMFNHPSLGGTWRFDRPTSTHYAANVMKFASLPAVIRSLTERLRRVYIDSRPAVDFIEYIDGEDELIYVDPPYSPDTCANHYAHNMTRADHERLADCLRSARGMVMLSGYDCPDYDHWYGDWHCERFATTTNVGIVQRRPSERTECLWFNPAAWDRRRSDGADRSLFGGDNDEPGN